MRVELSRFKVKQDKSARVTEWMAMINARMDEIQKIIPTEQMKLEVIFREMIGGEEFLYWFSVQGEEGVDADTSAFSLVHDFSRFHGECIDHGYGMRDAQPQVVIVPPETAKAMEWAEPMSSVVAYEAHEIIHRPPAE
jgi:hypothetical protein